MISELLNTLYVQTQGAYLRIDHETVRVDVDGQNVAQVPLHHLGGFAVFGNVLLSPFLIQRCGEDKRDLAWFTNHGRFKARLSGVTSGNVLLRLAQHGVFQDASRRTDLARFFVAGKLRNARVVLQRARRDGAQSEALDHATETLDKLLDALAAARNVEAILGVEGTGSAAYFHAFPSLLRVETFQFEERNRRPPRDPINALLSFAYALLANECASALEGVGLDPQIGFLHSPRPGRASLALDLMEEFRACLADRAVLALVNRQQIEPDDFVRTEGGAVSLSDAGRHAFLVHWQKRKQETIEHPILKRPVPLGLLPHVQGRLLARYLRGDIPEYPSFAFR